MDFLFALMNYLEALYSMSHVHDIVWSGKIYTQSKFKEAFKSFLQPWSFYRFSTRATFTSFLTMNRILRCPQVQSEITRNNSKVYLPYSYLCKLKCSVCRVRTTFFLFTNNSIVYQTHREHKYDKIVLSEMWYVSKIAFQNWLLVNLRSDSRLCGTALHVLWVNAWKIWMEARSASRDCL